MTTSSCIGCGALRQPDLDVCPDCGTVHDTLVYDMEGWEPGERAALDELLRGEGIPSRWEGDDLLVPDEHEQAMEDLMDRVEFPDALEAAELSPDDDDEVDDEAVYRVMSDLFVAADRLAGERVVEGEVAAQLVTASAAASATPPPYGVEPRVWAQVQKLAQGVVAVIEGGTDHEVARRDAGALRDLLRLYV